MATLLHPIQRFCCDNVSRRSFLLAPLIFCRNYGGGVYHFSWFISRSLLWNIDFSISSIMIIFPANSVIIIIRISTQRYVPRLVEGALLTISSCTCVTAIVRVLFMSLPDRHVVIWPLLFIRLSQRPFPNTFYFYYLSFILIYWSITPCPAFQHS